MIYQVILKLKNQFIYQVHLWKVYFSSIKENEWISFKKKRFFIWFSRFNWKCSCEYSKIIEEKSTVKDLGVLLTDDAKFKKHINSMIKKATELVGWVLRTFKSRSKEVMTTLWKSLISHHLDYCSQLWNPQEKGLIQGIKAVQR